MSYLEFNAAKQGLPVNAAKPIRDRVKSEFSANRALARKAN